MIWIGWFILLFAVIQFVVALLNLLFSANLQRKAVLTRSEKLVSVLIPARNEEKNITSLLLDLQHQTYKNLEILIYNDQSEDRTANFVEAMAKYDKRISLINGQELPLGWIGKNNACHQLSKMAHGEYFLFLDADVRLSENTVAKSLKYLEKSKSDVLTIFPKQLLFSIGEKAVVPLMNYILLTLLPLFLVRHSFFASLSAANGQFMLFKANVYKELAPHELFKAEKVEDIRIAKLIKKRKFKLSCISASQEICCRMYGNYNESINGFTKNAVMFFGNSYVLAFIFWSMTTFGWIVVLYWFPINWFILLIALNILTRIFVSLKSGQGVIANIFLLIPQQLNLGYILYNSLQKKIYGNYNWKGRLVN